MSPGTARCRRRLGASGAHFLVALSVRRLPPAAAERYLEEFQADLAELERSGSSGLLRHALGIVSTSRRFSMAVAGPSSKSGGTWALRALAHLGLVADPRGPDARDGAYVFPPGHTLRWRPLRHGETINLSD